MKKIIWIVVVALAVILLATALKNKNGSGTTSDKSAAGGIKQTDLTKESLEQLGKEIRGMEYESLNPAP